MASTLPLKVSVEEAAGISVTAEEALDGFGR